MEVIRGCILLWGDLLTSLSETQHKKLFFRLLSSELGGQTSSKPLSHGLPRVFIDWLLNTLQKLHFVGLAEAAVQLISAFFGIKLFVIILLHDNWNTSWQNPHSVAEDVAEVNHLPVDSLGAGPCDKGSFLTFLWHPVHYWWQRTLLLLSRGRKKSFDRITSKLCRWLGQYRRLLEAGVHTARTLYLYYI